MSKPSVEQNELSVSNERSEGLPENRLPVARISGKFAPGVSGNPGGAPAGTAALKALARQNTVEAIEGILSIARTEKQARTRLMAWDIILDRGWGKPAQMIETDGEQLVVIVKTIGGADPFVLPESRTKALPESVS